MNPVLLMLATAPIRTHELAGATTYSPLSLAQSFGVMGGTLAVVLTGSLAYTQYIAPRLTEKQRWQWEGAYVWLVLPVVQVIPMGFGWRPFDPVGLGISFVAAAAGTVFGVWLRNRTWPPRQPPAPPPDHWPSDRSST